MPFGDAAEVNEEILEQYLKVVKRWYCIGDIPFTVPHNYSNIDVLGYDPIANEHYDFEVKFRSSFSLTNNGDGKVVVTTRKMLGKSETKRSEMESTFHKKMMALGYKSELWYFDDMIPELVAQVDIKGRYNTQLLQTIRMLKLYEAK